MPDGSAIATSDPPAAPRGSGFDSAGAAAQARLAGMFRSHHAIVWRTLRRRGLDPDAAADATQQCFLIAAERLADIRGDAERAFLLGTALRLALSAFRSSHRFETGSDLDQHVKPGRGLDELVDQNRALDLLDRALARLTPDLLEVFVLFEIEQLTTPEIAALVQIPVGTAASRLRRAREGFRAALSQMERGGAAEESRAEESK
jgi:RNA polymerase sigma-70 factor, ECF subfamily